MNAGGPRPRVLIVDDISDNIAILGRSLESDHEISFVLSGPQALALIANQPPDLVLLDVMMPGMDGLETLRRIKALPGAQDVPVIMVTGDGRSETHVLGLELGAADFLSKPVDLSILRARVRNVLERERLVAAVTTANRELERLLEFNELLLSAAGQGIYGIDVDGLCNFINPAAAAMTGFAEGEVIGCNPQVRFQHQGADGTPYGSAGGPIRRTLEDGVRREIEDVFIRKDGQALPVHLAVTPMIRAGRQVGAEVVFEDISERKRLERQLVHLATTDGLTAVANRRRFFQLAEAELLRVRRYGSSAGLLMVDLDQFKQVNDRYGHAAGDAVLRHFAGLARERLRAVDTIGRIGGEEFAILLPDTAGKGAEAFAEQLRAHTAASSVATPHGRVSFSISIGVTAIVPTDRLLDQVLARADAALYLAKDSGRNRVELAAVPLATLAEAGAPAGGVPEGSTAGAPACAQLPVLAVGEALERLDGDRAMFMLAASPLPAQIAGDRASIAEAVRVGDSVAMRRAAHRLRGALALVGAQRACAACQALEVAVKERSVFASPDSSADEAVFHSLRQALEYELDALLPELLALLRAPDGDLAKVPTEESTHAR